MSEKLKEDYQKACEAYIEEFATKQDMEFEGWVANVVGDIAYFGDYFFNFRDIVWDINSNQPKGLILDWYNRYLEDVGNCVNYYSFTKSIQAKHISEIMEADQKDNIYS